jgi:hypothetical protein
MSAFDEVYNEAVTVDKQETVPGPHPVGAVTRAIETIEPPIVEHEIVVAVITVEAVAIVPAMATPPIRPEPPAVMTVPIARPAAMVIAVIAVVVVMVAVVIVVITVMVVMITVVIMMVAVVIVVITVMIVVVAVMIAMMITMVPIMIGCHRGGCADKGERSRSTEASKMFHREVPRFARLEEARLQQTIIMFAG